MNTNILQTNANLFTCFSRAVNSVTLRVFGATFATGLSWKILAKKSFEFAAAWVGVATELLLLLLPLLLPLLLWLGLLPLADGRRAVTLVPTTQNLNVPPSALTRKYGSRSLLLLLLTRLPLVPLSFKSPKGEAFTQVRALTLPGGPAVLGALSLRRGWLLYRDQLE